MDVVETGETRCGDELEMMMRRVGDVVDTDTGRSRDG